MDYFVKCPASTNKRKPNKDLPITTYIRTFTGHRPSDYQREPSAKPSSRLTYPWVLDSREGMTTTYTSEFQRRKLDPLVPVHFDIIQKLKVFQKHFPMETRTENMTYGTIPTRKAFIDERMEKIKRERSEVMTFYQRLPKYPPRPYDYSKVCEQPTYKYYVTPRTMAKCSYD